MRITGSIIMIALMGFTSCKARSPGSKTKVDTARINGFIAPGKGFNLAASDVTAAQCVVGDRALDSSDFSSPTENTSPTPAEATPSSNPLSPLSPSNPGKPSLPSDLKLSGNDETAKLGDIEVEFASASGQGASENSGLKLNGQAGGASIKFYYLNAIKDVSASIEASYANNTGVKASENTLSAEIASNFDAQLTAKYKNTTDKVFILMHGRLEHPPRASDAIATIPYFNTKLRNVVFDGNAFPNDTPKLAASWRRMLQTCGDHFIEYTVPGREIWMVAIMNKRDFETTMGTNINYGSKASGSFGDTASASKEIKAGMKGDSSVKLHSQRVEVIMQTRGKNDVTLGQFTLEESLAAMNKFLTSQNGHGESILKVGIRNYDNVIFPFEKGIEKRGGNIFTREVREEAGLNTDIFVKLQTEENWAGKEADRIWNSYGWEQWSLDPNRFSGVASQYKELRKYQKEFSTVFEYCGGRNSDVNTVSSDCLAQAKMLASKGRPQINLPQSFEHRIALWLPADTVAAANAGKLAGGATATEFKFAKETCASDGWTLPDEDGWKKILDASDYYVKWQKDQNPGYRPDEDKSHLAYPCGRFGGGYFWSATAGRVVEITNKCLNGNVQEMAIPDSQRFSSFIFWTKEKAHFGCVRYLQK